MFFKITNPRGKIIMLLRWTMKMEDLLGVIPTSCSETVEKVTTKVFLSKKQVL